MTDPQSRLVANLGALHQLIHTAQMHVIHREYEKATDILQGRATPLLQTISHEVWLNHHTSGVVK